MADTAAFDKWFQKGRYYNFYGVDGNRFKIGSEVFEAIEDECDGYRSYLGSIEVKDKSEIFFKTAIARVTVTEEDYDGFRGYCFTDATGHCWLKIGTNEMYDYYPCFVFHYEPKQPKPEPVKAEIAKPEPSKREQAIVEIHNYLKAARDGYDDDYRAVAETLVKKYMS